MMPGLAARRLAVTSSSELPIEEMIPMPVTTTRLILSSLLVRLLRAPWRRRLSMVPIGPDYGRSGTGLLCHHLRVGEQAYAQVLRLVNHLAVGLDPAIGNAQRQPALHHALEVDAIFDQLDVIGHLAGELDFPAQCAAAAGLADPAQEKARHLPDGVEP